MALKSDYSGLESKGERENGGMMSYAKQCGLKYEAIKSNLEILMCTRWQRLICCSTVNPLWVHINSADVLNHLELVESGSYYQGHCWSHSGENKESDRTMKLL